MAKPEPSVGPLGQQVRAHELVDGLDHRRRRHVEHLRQQLEAEPAAQHRGDARRTPGVDREPVQPLAHRLGHTLRQALLRHVRHAVRALDEPLLEQAAKQLDEQMRVALGAIGQLQQLGRRARADDVGDDEGDVGRLQPVEPQMIRARGQQAIRDRSQFGWRSAGPQRDQPDDRQRPQALRQYAQRGERARVGPLDIVEGDEHRLHQSAPLEPRLDLGHLPERGILGERRRQQRHGDDRHHPVPRLGGRGRHPYPHRPRPCSPRPGAGATSRSRPRLRRGSSPRLRRARRAAALRSARARRRGLVSQGSSPCLQQLRSSIPYGCGRGLGR